MQPVLLKCVHTRLILSFVAVFLGGGFTQFVLASSTDGTIDALNRYAWSENAGWIDFGSSEGNVHVADTFLTGYAWSELTGWISLNCSNTTTCGSVDYKVTNNSEGTLGGYAWSENIGWIDFDPANGGVTINASGIFSGTAWGENIGWIVFNCATTSSCGTTSYTVSTDWRHASSRSSGASSSTPDISTDSAGGGGGGGRRPSTLQNLVAQAQKSLLARYQDSLIARGQSSSSSASFNGTRTIVRKPGSSSPSSPNLLAIAERRGRLLAMVGDTSILYRDVETNAWYAPYIAELITQGIAQGYKDDQGKLTGEFGVANPVTVAEVLKMALEAAGKAPDLSLKVAPQNKTARGTWAAAYVKEAEDMQLTIFRTNPDINVAATRGEVIQTVLEALGFLIPKTPSSFADVPSTHPYTQAIGLAAYSGFVEGDKGPDGLPLNRFRPDEHINRAEVSKIIALMKEVAKQ